MDKATTAAREHIASLADLIGAVRLPEGSMRAMAGTEVVIDVLVFQRRAEGQAPSGVNWMHLRELLLDPAETTTEQEDQDETVSDVAAGEETQLRRHERKGVIQINEYFADHPEMVLGTHGQRRGIYGPGWSYTCRPIAGAPALETQLDAALQRLPSGILPATQPSDEITEDEIACVRPDRRRRRHH